MRKTMTSTAKALAGATVALAFATGVATAADEGHAHVDRQHWTFSGFFGTFDDAQLQRGFQIYREVCSTCHGLKRVAFRNLAEKSGPNFPEAGVKSLAAEWPNQIFAGPNDQGEIATPKGEIIKRPATLADPILGPYDNDKAARAAQNGALPPDLSLVARARTVEADTPFYRVPLALLRDVLGSYQEGGADYIHALLTGYVNPPADVKLSPGMNYNNTFPGHQIAMANPFAGGDGMVKYQDGTPATVDQYARDVVAFLSWAADPNLETRKRMGLMVILYLVVTTVLVYFAKKRVWSKIPH